MCGRFSIVDGTRKVELRFGGKYTEAQFETYYSAHYNAAPSMMLPIVIAPFPYSKKKELIFAKWGLETYSGDEVVLMPQPNARLETAKTKKTFRNAFRDRHCLIPANSYFEWMRTSKFKQPYRIMMKDDALFAMAGIWEDSIRPGEPPTFAVLTTKPNSLLARIHDRMPVILRKEQEDMWLREVGTGVMPLADMHFPSEKMKYYAVTRKMNKVSFDNPEAIAPVPEPSLGL